MQKQFNERLEVFFNDKFNNILNNHSVDKTYPNCKSINISGDYRAIFIEHDDSVIFLTIGTHSDLY